MRAVRDVVCILPVMAVAVAVQAQGPSIAPEAEAVLRAWSERSGQIQSAVFRVADTVDEVMPDPR